MNTFIQECLENHKRLWLWIAEETRRNGYTVNKTSYFKDYPLEFIPLNHCYLCQMSLQIETHFKDKEYDECRRYCPAIWVKGKEDADCQSLGSPYDKLYSMIINNEEDKIEEYASLCEEIANISIDYEKLKLYEEKIIRSEKL